MRRKIRMGMVGGGQGAFIGAVHRMAAALDGQIELVCGAFSSDPSRSKAMAQDLYLDPQRAYGSFGEMIETEAGLSSDIKMDFVTIVTPNYLHFAPAKLALENGFHVVCDKPLAFNLEEARALKKLVDSSGLLFALTHNYTAYPMVKQAKGLIRDGVIGKIRRVMVEYPQGWLSTNIESSNHKQASWRTDPAKSGATGAMGDIGTHAENLAEYITGLEIAEICADLHTHVDGRLLDDDGSVLLRFNNGARGVLSALQISAGEENALSIKIYGDKGGLEWHQMEPNSLHVQYLDKPKQIYRTGVGSLYPEAAAHTRLPAGHPEGYLEAFANIYRNFAHCLQARLEGETPDQIFQDYPSIDDGIRGMRFLEKVVASSQSSEKWTKMS